MHHTRGHRFQRRLLSETDYQLIFNATNVGNNWWNQGKVGVFGGVRRLAGLHNQHTTMDASIPAL
jgi:hypothetical protein